MTLRYRTRIHHIGVGKLAPLNCQNPATISARRATPQVDLLRVKGLEQQRALSRKFVLNIEDTFQYADLFVNASECS